MQAFFNQYSYAIFNLLIIVLTAAILWRLKIGRKARLITGGLVILMLVSGYALVRPGTSDIQSVEAAEAVLQNGKPTFLEFFSNYCTGCVVVKPAVNAVVNEIQGEFNILRIDIYTDFGLTLRERLNFKFTPEFILFNTAGEEVWRGHNPPSPSELALAK